LSPLNSTPYKKSHVDVSDFLADFNFSAREFGGYFDDRPDLPEHVALAQAFPDGFAWNPLVDDSRPIAPALPEIPTPMSRRRKGRRPDGALTAHSTRVEPPRGTRWWDAEQAVRLALESNGWTVVDVSRLGVGYDLLASKGDRKRYVEVKSSAGLCSPLLTVGEYEEARRLRREFVLAILEEFDPASPRQSSG
jgi:Domain of unknown function (DUF3883)